MSEMLPKASKIERSSRISLYLYAQQDCSLVLLTVSTTFHGHREGCRRHTSCHKKGSRQKLSLVESASKAGALRSDQVLRENGLR